MPHYAYIVVEGPHDIEFIARLLRPHGFRRIQYQPELDPFWLSLVLTRFPHRDDLLKRVPVPVFFQNQAQPVTHSIAIQSAQGYTRLVETIQETRSILPGSPDSIGVFLDADDTEPVGMRFNRLLQAMQAANPDLVLPAAPGLVTQSTPAVGVFILPDNRQPGTLEHLLLGAARVSYPGLLEAAEQYVQSIDLGQLTRHDQEEINKPAGRSKVKFSSMASVLRPGKAVQVSIQDNRWLEGSALDLPGIQTINLFLQQLLRLTA